MAQQPHRFEVTNSIPQQGKPHESILILLALARSLM